MHYWKIHKIPLLFTFISIAFYLSFAYDLVRTDYLKLITLYTALFFLFYKLVTLNKQNFKLLVIIAVLFRLLLLFATPNLSQDFYRFIWDGRMLFEGFNPYLYTPESFINKGEFPIAQAQELYDGMGQLNASHFTNYPPINQLCFFIAALFAGKSILGSVVVMRIIIIAADIGTLYFGKKLLKKLNIPVHNIFWYLLNPFIIIELTGNLHFEGVMLFFLVCSLYLLHSKYWQRAAMVFAVSISVKLMPLIFLPLFFKWFNKENIVTSKMKQSSAHEHKIATSQAPRNDEWIPAFSGISRLIGFYSLVGITTIAMFLPFYNSEFINNYAQTVGLWFQNFEFNASLYYVARAIGYRITGFNEIAVIGKILAAIVVVTIVIMALVRKLKTTKQLIISMLLVLSLYFFASTTVHPWYIATLLGLSVFTDYKFPRIWSFTIMLSYLAYATANNTENLWLIALEYLIVYAVFMWEVLFKEKIPVKTSSEKI